MVYLTSMQKLYRLNNNVDTRSLGGGAEVGLILGKDMARNYVQRSGRNYKKSDEEGYSICFPVRLIDLTHKC